MTNYSLQRISRFQPSQNRTNTSHYPPQVSVASYLVYYLSLDFPIKASNYRWYDDMMTNVIIITTTCEKLSIASNDPQNY